MMNLNKERGIDLVYLRNDKSGILEILSFKILIHYYLLSHWTRNM